MAERRPLGPLEAPAHECVEDAVRRTREGDHRVAAGGRQAVHRPADEERGVAHGVGLPDGLLDREVLLGGHDPLDEGQHDGLLVVQVLAEHLPQAGEADVEGVAVLLARVVDDGGEPTGDGLEEGVDAGVLLGHGADLGEIRGGAPRLDRPEERRPVELVLRGVVVVQRRAEARPPSDEGLPGGGVGERRGPHRGGEGGQVTPERVVHDVHAGVVVRALGDVGLAGEVDLAAGRRGGGSGGHRGPPGRSARGHGALEVSTVRRGAWAGLGTGSKRAARAAAEARLRHPHHRRSHRVPVHPPRPRPLHARPAQRLRRPALDPRPRRHRPHGHRGAPRPAGARCRAARPRPRPRTARLHRGARRPRR